ncbi:hypothetical protein E4T56_gene16376 [Termitomyces sp. T112]|nr:hypothetical protein E4T56_gene16376 [Termitomyces sp. T112]
MFQLFSMFPLLVIILEFSVIIISANGLHLYSQDRDNQLSLPSRRTVYNPKITSPVETTTWNVGHQAVVTWDLHDIPKESWKQKSMIVLGWVEQGNLNEHLDLDHPLAKDFELSDRRATITVPNVPPKDNYIVVVFGDSGNRSPAFSIKP